MLPNHVIIECMMKKVPGVPRDEDAVREAHKKMEKGFPHIDVDDSWTDVPWVEDEGEQYE